MDPLTLFIISIALTAASTAATISNANSTADANMKAASLERDEQIRQAQVADRQRAREIAALRANQIATVAGHGIDVGSDLADTFTSDTDLVRNEDLQRMSETNRYNETALASRYKNSQIAWSETTFRALSNAAQQSLNAYSAYKGT